MRLVLSAVLVVIGLLLLATPALPVGLALMGLAVLGFRSVTPAAEERFTAALMLLGGAGAAVVVVRFVLQQMS